MRGESIFSDIKLLTRIRLADHTLHEMTAVPARDCGRSNNSSHRSQQRQCLVTLENVLCCNWSDCEMIIGTIDQIVFFALYQSQQHATTDVADTLTGHCFMELGVGIAFS